MINSKDLIAKAKKFYENKNFFEAKTYLLKALNNNQMDKAYKLGLYVLISDICYKINDFKDAEKYLLKSIEGGKFNSEIFNFLGNIYLKKRDYKNSEKFYLKSINLESNNEIALTNLAILYHNLGKQKKAIYFYKKILEKNPKNIGVLYNLSNIDQLIIDDTKIEILKNLIFQKKTKSFNLAACFFLLANVEKQKKNFTEEINLLKKANSFSFKSNENKNVKLNKYWLKGISKKVHRFEYVEDEKYLIDTKNIYPIFIIGLPRCGSTLIESIISSGDKNFQSLGETNLINWALLNTNNNLVKSLEKEDLIQIDLNKTAEKLNNAIKNLVINKDNQKTIFSEKSLENFFYIELILKIYPNAKFINPHRNLIDNIFAIYKQFLPNISWSHSLDDILPYIDNYLITMNFFKKKYPNKILSIPLEHFTKKPKNCSIEIYKFCNLTWNEECLNFHKRSDLFINTASTNQIRTNIRMYDGSKYRAYKEILKTYTQNYKWLKY